MIRSKIISGRVFPIYIMSFLACLVVATAVFPQPAGAASLSGELIGKWKINADDTVKYSVMAANKRRPADEKINPNSSESQKIREGIKKESRGKLMKISSKSLQLVKDGKTVTTLSIVNFSRDKKSNNHYITVDTPKGKIKLIASLLKKDKMLMGGLQKGLFAIYDRVR